MTAEGTTAARGHFERALVRDPEFALACNALAELYWYLGLLGYAPSRETDLIGRSYALRALKSDSSSAETHALLSLFPGKQGCSDEISYYDWSQIEDEVERSRELDPSQRLVQLRYAMVQAILGRLDGATLELERAIESDPLSFHLRCWLIMVLFLGRHLDRALEETLLLKKLELEHYLPNYQLGYVYLGMKRFEESAAAFRKAIEGSHELPILLGYLGLAWSGPRN